MRDTIVGLSILVAAWMLGSPSHAAQFTCEEGECRCDGTYRDCKAMEKNCKAGSMVCSQDGKICYCVHAGVQGGMPALEPQSDPARPLKLPQGNLQPQ
jgi:hypothetical protein